MSVPVILLLVLMGWSTVVAMTIALCVQAASADADGLHPPFRSAANVPPSAVELHSV